MPLALRLHVHITIVKRTQQRARHVMAAASSSNLRPTHFVAFRLPCQELHARLRTVQEQVIARDSGLQGCDVPPEKTHLTGFVMHLADEGGVDSACKALRACSSLPSIVHGPCPRLPLSGLASFSTRVLFVRVPLCDEETMRVSALVDGMASQFRAHGIAVQHDDGRWTPHVTLLKASRVASSARGRRRKPPSITSAAWAGIVWERECHSLATAELCSMQGVGSDGFYRVLATLPLGDHAETPRAPDVQALLGRWEAERPPDCQPPGQPQREPPVRPRGRQRSGSAAGSTGLGAGCLGSELPEST